MKKDWCTFWFEGTWAECSVIRKSKAGKISQEGRVVNGFYSKSKS